MRQRQIDTQKTSPGIANMFSAVHQEENVCDGTDQSGRVRTSRDTVWICSTSDKLNGITTASLHRTISAVFIDPVIYVISIYLYIYIDLYLYVYS